jgi:hypothetical protein
MSTPHPLNAGPPIGAASSSPRPSSSGLLQRLGGYNHKVLVPALDSAPDDAAFSRQFRNVVTGEAVALNAVAVANAFLVGAAS